MSLNLKGKMMKKIALEEVLTGIMFFLTLIMAIVNIFLIMNILDK